MHKQEVEDTPRIMQRGGGGGTDEEEETRLILP